MPAVARTGVLLAITASVRVSFAGAPDVDAALRGKQNQGNRRGVLGLENSEGDASKPAEDCHRDHQDTSTPDLPK